MLSNISIKNKINSMRLTIGYSVIYEIFKNLELKYIIQFNNYKLE